MAIGQASEVIRHFRRAVLLRDGARLTDGQLLEDYLSRSDDAALAALVQRHAPMVWGVCCRVLHNHHDAEDAFQATFLVLVRRAASIASRELLANWLYGVAHQTALKARAMVAKRRGREKQVTEMPEPAVAAQDLWDDLLPLLDQELNRLPDRYRVAVVLCDLEGKTRKEAARQLGLPEGTVGSRLARARAMLAKGLARHGLAMSGGALAAVLTQKVASEGVPTSVVSSTIKAASLFAAGKAAAAGVISAKVAPLMEGVLKSMLLTKLRTAVVGLLLMVALSGGAGLIYQSQAAEQAKDSKNIFQAPNPADKVTPPPATRAGKTSPQNAKQEPDVLTPEEAIKQRSKEKLTVQFKATKIIVQPLRGVKVEGYQEDPFIRLIAGKDFSALLRGPASYQINRLGIDPSKHFSGKSIRVTGRVLPDPIQIMRLDVNPPTVVDNDKGPPFQIVVDDLDQFEVVTE